MTQTVGVAEETLLYMEVQHFYGRQMRYMDSGAAREWAGTFTEDGVFAANAHPHPQRGRAAIEQAARSAHQRLTEQGVQRRHWLGMLEVEQQPDGTILARTYALITSTPAGGAAAIALSCTCTDVLVRAQGRLLVSQRTVCRDDLPLNDNEMGQR